MMNKFLEYGFPARLITDNGPNFRAKLMEQMCLLLDTKHLFTTPYHPQFDGLCERFNRTLTSMLRGFVAKNQGDWDVHLPYVMYAYRAAVQESTQETPFFLMFGRPTREPLDLLLRPEEGTIAELHSDKPAMVTRMHQAFNQVQSHLQEAHERQKKYHDHGSKERNFEVGDEVMLLDERVPVGQTKKLHPPWKPGYRVLEKVGPLNLKIEHPNQRGKVLRVHVNRVKPQKRKHVWPGEASERSEGRMEVTRSTQDSPLDRWIREERSRHRPFPDHWSGLDETETEEDGTPREESDPGTPREEPNRGTPREEPDPETPRGESNRGTPREEPGPEMPREEPDPEMPREEPDPGTPREEPGPEMPREEPDPEMPREEPDPGTPREEPGPEMPREEPDPEMPREEPDPGTPREEPDPEMPREEPDPEMPREEPDPEMPREEPDPGTPREEPGPEMPREEPDPGTPREEPGPEMPRKSRTKGRPEKNRTQKCPEKSRTQGRPEKNQAQRCPGRSRNQ